MTIKAGKSQLPDPMSIKDLPPELGKFLDLVRSEIYRLAVEVKELKTSVVALEESNQ